MADAPEERKPSKLRTLLWTAAAVTLAVAGTSLLGGLPLVGGFLAEHGALLAVAKWGMAIFAASKAWGSHKENNEIEQENNARAAQFESQYRQRQIAAERAAAVAQMQDQDAGTGTQWRDTISAQRAYSQNVR